MSGIGDRRSETVGSTDPTDRRGVQVVLTDSGRAAVDGSLVDLMERERALLDHLTRREQQDLANLLRRLPD